MEQKKPLAAIALFLFVCLSGLLGQEVGPANGALVIAGGQRCAPRYHPHGRRDPQLDKAIEVILQQIK
jgi:hypothetical protein